MISESNGGKRLRDKIELDRFGRPVVGGGGALTAKKLRTLDTAAHNDSDSDDTMDTRTSRASTLRARDETAEQRRARKAAVRAERRERRMEKKANTIAFKVSACRPRSHTPFISGRSTPSGRATHNESSNKEGCCSCCVIVEDVVIRCLLEMNGVLFHRIFLLLLVWSTQALPAKIILCQKLFQSLFSHRW